MKQCILKMAASVKKDGIRKRRFPQSSTKHALSSPYNLHWPRLVDGNNKKIIDEIQRTLVPLQFKQLSTRMPSSSADDSEETKARILEEQEERAKKQELRSSLVIGLNQVTRALERGTLKLVLVDRAIKPTTLLEHLLILCATRNTPACALSGMGESAIPILLGIHRVAAFGFKNTNCPNVFDELVDFIKERIPPLYVPWLHHSKEHSEPSGTANTATDATNDNDSDEEHLPGIKEMHKRKKRRRNKKHKENSELTAQTTAANPERLAENTGKAVGNTGFPNGSTGKPGKGTSLGNTGVPSGSTGQPIKNTGKPGKVKLSRAELLARFGTSHSAPILHKAGEDASRNEQKEKKKRSKRSKKKQGKKKTEPPVQLVYLRPCIKSFDTVPKDKEQKN